MVPRIDKSAAAIAQAEQADAVLNVNGDPKDLVRTVRYLLTGRC